jgi:zeaxanthin glucosyltransferase
VLAAPFSTDQFAGAEDLRRAGLGDAVDPATTTADEIVAALASLFGGDAAHRAAVVGTDLRRSPGAGLAADFVETAAATPALVA